MGQPKAEMAHVLSTDDLQQAYQELSGMGVHHFTEVLAAQPTATDKGPCGTIMQEKACNPSRPEPSALLVDSSCMPHRVIHIWVSAVCCTRQPRAQL